MIKRILCCLLLMSLVVIPVQAEDSVGLYTVIDKNFSEVTIKDFNGVVFDLNVTSEDKKELSIGQVLSAQEINKLKDNYSNDDESGIFYLIAGFVAFMFIMFIIFA